MSDNRSPIVRFPAEWEPQSAVQLTWPHPGTDWLPILDDAVRVFADIAAEVSKRETLLIVCHDVPTVKSQLRNDTDATASASLTLTLTTLGRATMRRFRSSSTTSLCCSISASTAGA